MYIIKLKNKTMKFSLILIIVFITFLFTNKITISAEEINTPPIANGGKVTSVESGEVVFFSSFGSIDPDGQIILYEWDFEGDGKYDWQNEINGTTTHIYKIPRAYNATLRVTDNNKTSSTDIYYVLVLSPEKEDKELDQTVKLILTFVGIGEIIFGIILLGSMYKLKKEEDNEGNGENNSENK